MTFSLTSVACCYGSFYDENTKTKNMHYILVAKCCFYDEIKEHALIFSNTAFYFSNTTLKETLTKTSEEKYGE